jgi:hypothetical protein
MRTWRPVHLDVPRFDREFFDGTERFTRIGDGEVGGKAAGLLFARDVLARRVEAGRFPRCDVHIPILTVITTELFERFVAQNHLAEIAASEEPDGLLAHAFQHGSLPPELVGDLRALIEKVHTPLAVRSSSLLEDDLHEPFAGVYVTKMIPNHQLDVDSRFRRLVEAVKYVWASTYFAGARSYRRSTGHADRDEKMAVIVQEVVGRRHGGRFYPDLSGVARSYSFYRTGQARPEDGVVSLALGLGKTIVDGGIAWTYSPRFPRVAPPTGSVRDLLRQTQVEFWAVNMGKPPAYDPVAETEYLIRAGLPQAEDDGTLQHVASTYDPASDRLSPGIDRAGARVLNFAPLLSLETFPLNDLGRGLLAACQEAVDAPVEIEFAATFDRERMQFGFLQVRPMVTSDEAVDLTYPDLDGSGVVVASDSVMGNGTLDGIQDLVFVKPETFEAGLTPVIASEIAALNRRLVADARPYVLIGFGRWGSSDPWLGIPVVWGQIGGARVIVEVSDSVMNVELSQGSHFFHNVSSFRVPYFSVKRTASNRVDWTWLAGLPIIEDTGHVCHVRAPEPVRVQVDGRQGHGLILQHED